MGQKLNHFRRRKEARKELSDLFANGKSVVVVHYSCESFYDREDGSSPRVTCIAVRNLASGQTKSFSIHQIAEKGRKKLADIAANFGLFRSFLRKNGMTYIAKMTYLQGFTKTQAGAAYGSSHPGKDFGA